MDIRPHRGRAVHGDRAQPLAVPDDGQGEQCFVFVRAGAGPGVGALGQSGSRNAQPAHVRAQAAPDTAFLPKDNRMARLISSSRTVPGPELKDMLAAYNAAKRKAEASTP